jgi:hypothetical protein
MGLGLTRSGKITVLAALAVLVVLVGAAVFVLRPETRRALGAFVNDSRGAARAKGALSDSLYPPVRSFGQIGSGWIYLGPYDREQQAYREGPYVEVVVCITGGRTGSVVPHRGDVLRVLRASHVAIGNYRIEGLTHQDVPPPQVHEMRSRLDLTGLRLREGDLVVALDVQQPWRLGKPRALWCRVGPCDPTSEPCARARAAVGAPPDSL